MACATRSSGYELQGVKHVSAELVNANSMFMNSCCMLVACDYVERKQVSVEPKHAIHGPRFRD
jgi:hypothetical protein